MAKKATINEKLKESVTRSLVQARERKNKTNKTNKPSKKADPNESEDRVSGDVLDAIGIPRNTTRRPSVTVYKLWRHPRATLDHVKFPNAKWERIEDSPSFASWQEGHEYGLELEKQSDRKYLYESRMTDIYVDECPADLLKKCKERGWGFH